MLKLGPVTKELRGFSSGKQSDVGFELPQESPGAIIFTETPGAPDTLKMLFATWSQTTVSPVCSTQLHESNSPSFYQGEKKKEVI